MNVAEAVQQSVVTKVTCSRRRLEYRGIKTNQAWRVKESERENHRLKKLVVDPSLNNAVLKEARSLIGGNQHLIPARG